MQTSEELSSRELREAKAERDLFRIIVVSTALGFGTLAAFLFSLRDIENDVSLEFSAATVIAFVVGAFSGWAFWYFLRRVARKKSQSSEQEKEPRGE